MRRYLTAWSYTPQRPIRRAYEQDNEAVKKWKVEQYPAIINLATINNMR